MNLKQIPAAFFSLKDSRLVRAAGLGAATDLAVLPMGLVTMALLVRFLGADTYGSYQYFIASAAVLSILCTPQDQLITRFFSTALAAQRANLVFTAILVKLIVFPASFGLAVGLAYVFWLDTPIPAAVLDDPYMVLALALILVEQAISQARRTVSRILAGLQKFHYLNLNTVLSSAGTLSTAVILTIVWAGADTALLVLFIAARMIVQVGLLAYSLVLVNRFWKGGGRALWRRLPRWRRTVARAYDGDGRRYVLPLTLSAVGSYFREQGPSIFLGINAESAHITYYRIGNRLFRIIYSIIFKNVNFVFSGLVKRRDDDRQSFDRRFNHLVIGTIWLLGVTSAMMMYLVEPLFWVLKLDVPTDLLWMCLVIGLSVIVDGMVSAGTFAFRFSTDTRPFALAQISSRLISIVLVGWLTVKLQILGAALGILGGSLFLICLLYFFALRFHLLDRKQFVNVLLTVVGSGSLYFVFCLPLLVW